MVINNTLNVHWIVLYGIYNFNVQFINQLIFILGYFVSVLQTFVNSTTIGQIKLPISPLCVRLKGKTPYYVSQWHKESISVPSDIESGNIYDCLMIISLMTIQYIWLVSESLVDGYVSYQATSDVLWLSVTTT